MMGFNTLLIFVLALLYTTLALSFPIDQWQFAGLAPLLISMVGILNLNGSAMTQRVMLALVPVMALPFLLLAFDMAQIGPYIGVHVAIIGLIICPALQGMAFIINAATRLARMVNHHLAARSLSKS